MRLHRIITIFFIIAIISSTISCSQNSEETNKMSDLNMSSEVVTEAPTEARKSSKTKKADGAKSSDAIEGGEESQFVDPKIRNAGILTAGEWNDLNNWKFWQNLMNSKEWSAMQTLWEFHPNYRLPIIVKNNNGRLLIDIQVELLNSNNKTIWKARTDNSGKAELWKNMFGGQENKFKIRLRSKDGEMKVYDNIKSSNDIIELKFDAEFEKIENLDIMLVVDATGSMGDEIDFLKNELGSIIEKVEKDIPNIKTRTGMVFYRDHSDEYLLRDFEFDTNIAAVLNNLDEQQAGGGGDFEEAVEIGLENAIQQKRWNENTATRLLFLILDAPPHKDAKIKKKLQKNARLAAEKGIKIIPIVASGIDKDTEFLMRFLSVSTNGTYVFLTDDSGVGKSHIEPTVGQHQVELLNNLIIRLIKKYTKNPRNV